MTKSKEWVSAVVSFFFVMIVAGCVLAMIVWFLLTALKDNEAKNIRGNYEKRTETN